MFMLPCPFSLGLWFNPPNAEATFVQSKMMQTFLKTTYTLAC